MEKNKIHIFDNFLPPEIENKFEDNIKFIPFRWAENKWKNYINIKVKDSTITNMNRPGLLQCLAFDTVWDVCTYSKWIEEIFHYLPFKYELQRIKVNYNPQVSKIYQNNCMHPHCDMNKGGFTAIYYVNDSDGDTIIFNEKTISPFFNGEELSIKKRIKNKRGRFVAFNQDYLHAGMLPISSDYRVVINFNFKVL